MAGAPAQEIALFALPKAFTGHIGVIQNNAIESWKRLPSCKVTLVGDDPGVAEAAKRHNVDYAAHVERTSHGTPRVDSIFETVERMHPGPLRGYVNADILLTADILKADRRVRETFPNALVIGRRWDVDIKEPLDFSPGWEDRLRGRAHRDGQVHAHTGIDYYLFPSGTWPSVPPFAIGRATWDSWLIFDAIRRGVPVVDVSPSVVVVHQNHDYSHHPQGAEGIWKGEEAKTNLALAGGITRAYTILDSQYILTPRRVRKRRSLYRAYRSLVSASEKHPSLRPILRLVRWVRG